MRAGQEVRARRAALIEAARSFSRTGLSGGDTSVTKSGLPSAFQATQILNKAREILRYYAHWESRIEHIDVRQPPALELGENAVLQERGILLNQGDTPSAMPERLQGKSASASSRPSRDGKQALQDDHPQDVANTAAAESGLGVISDAKA